MISESLAALRTHRNRIYRYRRLLETDLAVLDRQFIERRLCEEQRAFDALVSASFPFIIDISDPSW
ncbi:hypothetical protein [Bradyrhizobium ivorense]|uniref:hypothetical protein n=1 Tax=Bradyrhizobium ivorense TaxID=2511166 RepID=UPI0011164F18|nr:hypothetical protein [Bradyrhizobium ivorense]